VGHKWFGLAAVVLLVGLLATVLLTSLLNQPLKAPAGAKEALQFQLRRNSNDRAFAETVSLRLAANPWIIKQRVDPSGKTWWEVPLRPDQEVADLERAKTDPDVEVVRLVPWPPSSPGMIWN
jgi:hypothetical protein